MTQTDDPRLELVRASLDALPVGIVVEDADGNTVAANARARTPLDDFAGNSLAGAALERTMKRARAGESAHEGVDLHGPQPRRVELNAEPIAGGGVVGIVVDVSERLRLDAVRRDFVANINHELRTPIGALTLLSDALAGERSPEIVDRLADRIAREADRARALIEEVLDFARVDLGLPHHERVSLSEVIEQATSRVTSLAEQQGVRITVADLGAADDAPTVEGVEDQLVTAMTNLLENAIKYSDAGTTVWVDIESTSEATVAVTVADEGIGIPARDLDRVFERFYRVDFARDRRTGGTGLGLAIVRHVAANHGGDVSVKSEEGTGSVFTLHLPRTKGVT